MRTEKRDQLAGASALVIPVVQSQLDKALQFLGDNKVADAVVAIKEAKSQLDPIVKLFDAANEERRG